MNRRVQPFAIPVLAMVALLAMLPARAQDNAVAAGQEVRIQQLEGQIRTLNGQLEQMNYRVQQMSDRLDKLVEDMDYRLRQIEGGNAPPPAQGAAEQGAGSPPPQSAGQMPEQQATTENYSGGSETQSVGGGAPSGTVNQPKTLGTMSQSQYNSQTQQLNQNADAGAAAAAAGQAGNTNAPPATNNQQAYALPGANPDEQYQYAFDLMRQTKYAEAEKALTTFVDDYPDHPLAGNASYWLGETYYVRKDYNNAAQTFAQTFQRYPQSGKAPDSLLKLGMSLAALGETADACKALHELKVRYPKAPDGTKQRAAKEWAKNGCK